MLLQVDGSRHDWLEGRGPSLSLIGGSDDATGLVPCACLREQEDAHGYFQLFREVLRRRGVPQAVYSDQHSIFCSTKRAPTLDALGAGDPRCSSAGTSADSSTFHERRDPYDPRGHRCTFLAHRDAAHAFDPNSGGCRGFTLSSTVPTSERVDEVLAQAKAAGARS